MIQKLSVVQLMSLITITAGIGNTIARVMDDGQIDWKDAPSALGLLSQLKDLSKVDFTQVIPEINDLDKDEITQLGIAFDKEFNLTNESLEAKVEAGFAILLRSYDAIKFFKSLIK